MNGRTVAEDMDREYQRTSLRDTFAAAALTGMLDKHDAAEPKNMAAWWPEFVCSAAYRWADAMLRERERTARKIAESDSLRAGTGKQTAPPCVETDGFSPGSRTGPINRTPERESPRRECGESSLRDVPQPDNGRAAGGPERHIDHRTRRISGSRPQEQP